MSKLEKSSKNISSSSTFEQIASKGIESFLKYGDLKDFQEDNFVDSLKKRAISNAKWELHCFVADSRKGEYDWPEGWKGGVDEHEFFGHLGKLYAEIIPFGISIEEIDSDFKNKVTEAVHLYYSVSALQYFTELSSQYVDEEKPSTYYVNKIYYHLEKAGSTAKEALSVTDNQLKKVAERYERIRIKQLLENEEFLQERIEELEHALRLIERKKSKK